MSSRISSRQRHGFTTIESLIAAVVFLVGISGLLGALIKARGATGQARRLMQATDIANDLVEQIHLWRFDDPRLSPSPEPCASDPMDDGEALLDPNSSEYNTYVACMHNEDMLRLGGATFSGLPAPEFSDGSFGDARDLTYYKRFYIVRVQDVREGVRTKNIWVKVLYTDAGEPRVVTTHTLRVDMGGVL